MYVTSQECVDWLLHKWAKANSVVSSVRLSEPLFVFNSGLHEDAQLTSQMFLLLVFIPKDEFAAILWLSWSLPLLESNITVYCYRSQTVIITTWSSYQEVSPSTYCSCLQESAHAFKGLHMSSLGWVKSFSSHHTVHHIQSSRSMYLCTSLFAYRSINLLDRSKPNLLFLLVHLCIHCYKIHWRDTHTAATTAYTHCHNGVQNV